MKSLKMVQFKHRRMILRRDGAGLLSQAAGEPVAIAVHSASRRAKAEGQSGTQPWTTMQFLARLRATRDWGPGASFWKCGLAAQDTWHMAVAWPSRERSVAIIIFSSSVASQTAAFISPP